MSSLKFMKKECFASGTLSSASFKGTLSKIQSKRAKKRRVVPEGGADGECGFCRCSILSPSGSSRSVRRILAACLLSFAALLGSVSVDLNSNFDLLRTTEVAYDQLTSCRTMAIWRLVAELQTKRSLWSKTLSNETSEAITLSEIIVPVFYGLCDDPSTLTDHHGLSCGQELTPFCKDVYKDVQELQNSTWKDANVQENSTLAFSLVISKLLGMWGTAEQDIRMAKRYPAWRDVLSSRLLQTFIELHHQAVHLPPGTVRTDVFRREWTATLSRLGFALVMSETLSDCWLKNVDPGPNLTLLRRDTWEGSGPAWDPGIPAALLAAAGLQALRDAHECLLEASVPALWRAYRELLSGLSMRVCLLAMACLIYPVALVSFKQMTEWIQNYARNLREKTEALRLQRRLAEDLLNQMLPKTVAKQLRQHKHVEAESYDKVTIFFSDIVGFTTISASCNPLQVVEMLNNLYMCFDTRINSYDVYKVETIGDAYMVVSGLPERNGDKHADEIAKMSLDLLAAVRQVSIPHMPNQRLQLRAGIHTGPCVAGIVGYKMPRYCLFGDTVNTASRMESTSLPQKIHASSATYLALMKDNAYDLQLRGEIEVKGKGKMNTYWLIGHKNYSVQNDSLVCHWNPSMAKKKKKTVANSQGSVANSSVTVSSMSENPTSPKSIPSCATTTTTHTPPQQPSDRPGLCVSAQVEHCGGGGGGSGYNTLGSMIGGLQGGESPALGEGRARGGDKPDLLPGSIPHM
ncbi:hypothetical protein NHX12_012689 [Muraenolepis orangiensis]|uniref:Guanylate cyclase domain-containing protein n=1 Tax=Muraenolepis orangiensis TaxID=630683 RepID=A0A9Q0DD78_9TELE|nr:hypothetical protein NHX12_012689 [Muraenolepis orangiensis]